MLEDATPERIAALLQAAPRWCRVGLAAPSRTMRDRAARELGLLLAETLGDPAAAAPDARQLPLPIPG